MDTDLGTLLPLWSALPFAGMLLSIALLPLFAPRFWEHRHPAVAAAWALAFVVPFVAVYGVRAVHEVLHVAIVDYLPFLILLATLFTIGSGVFVRGTLRGSPAVNTVLLGIGAGLASWIGTTGAAMVMIRPLLRANRMRRHKAHTIVFFIFLVANIGGALTPLGDPPLFLGFLEGVPFFWTFSLWKELVFCGGIVLAIYAAVDARWWAREDAAVRAPHATRRDPIRIDGWHNVLLLLGVLAAVIGSGLAPVAEVSVLGVHQRVGNIGRDVVLLVLLVLSWVTTPARIRLDNEHSWGPIREVAVLFAGIFATIIPALAMLGAGEQGAMAPLVRIVREPAQFFWASGILSSFLDNAPTYLTFLSTALGRLYPAIPQREAIQRLIAEHHAFLQAIATGSVFMGANTYIGNAPNFMVKSIAESAGIRMPSFFGYIFRYSVPVLIPVFALATWIFFASAER